MKKKPENKVELLIEILAVLLAAGVVSVLATIFYLTSSHCGGARPIAESIDCYREPR